MAHFAKIGLNNKVIAVNVVADADCLDADNNEVEQVGIDFLERIHGWPLWVKTSYNTRANKHYDNEGNLSADQSKAFRGNYAGIGYTWDEDNDIFWPKKPYDSWVKNTTTAEWDAPVTKPTSEQNPDSYRLIWDEANTRWTGGPETGGDGDATHRWDTDSSTWIAL
jgi:hypothetical protein